jgi:hypothetical protein
MKVRQVTSYVDWWLLVSQRKLGYIIEIKYRATPQEFHGYQQLKKDYVIAQDEEES